MADKPAKDVAIRPRAAASLIVIDRSVGEPRFLLGRRHDAHVFMPGKYVFPGGKTDASDRSIRPARELDPRCLAALCAGPQNRAGAATARAFALSAVREAFEEAGLLVGCESPFSASHPAWQPFAARGLRPDLAALRFVARAITPPGYPRRYDTRFFAIFRDQLVETDMLQHADNEMLDFTYATHGETADMNLPSITRMILKALTERLTIDPALESGHPVPTFLTRRGKHICVFA